jgi:Bacterial extracellular solute-binding proteins, family 5 Middle
VRRVLLALLTAALACRPSRQQGEFRLRIALVGSFNPLVPGAEPSASTYAEEWVFESLLRTASDGSPIAGLAARFQFWSPARVSVELREGATFSDGSAVTAEDVRRSLRDVGFEVREQPRGLLIESPSGVPVEPILRQGPIYKRTGEGYVGSGPFRVVALDPERLLLRRRVHEPGKIDEVLLFGFPTAREPLAHTLAGDADLLIVSDPKQLEFFQGVSRLRVVRAHGANAIAVAMGFHRLDRAARTAIAAALPVEKISRLVFGKECPPFPVPSGQSAALPARALEVAVIRQDIPLEHTALAVARALGRSSGEIRFLSVTDALRLLKNQDFDLMMLRPLVWPPSAAAVLWASDSRFNDLNYRNPKVDAALKAGDWARAMQALRDDPPVAFICTPERLALVDSRVKNPQVGPYGYFETLPDWEVEQ